MVEKGELTPGEARVHPQRNYITRALGTNKHVKPDIISMDYRPGDVWLLCSDGLSNYLLSSELASIMMQKVSPEDQLQTMISEALRLGGSDNITAILAYGEAGDGE